MNQIKIGKFISQCRKENKLTQMQLAEKLNVTDRAVSKWENGRAMPDPSIMLELCEILKINVNELLSGERIEMNNYDKKVEENLLEMARREIAQNKKMMRYEIIIELVSLVACLALIFVASFIEMSNTVSAILIILGIILLFIGGSVGIKIETETGYYECKNCHNKYVPKYRNVYMAMHVGTTRYLKCPECGKRTWNKKVMSK